MTEKEWLELQTNPGALLERFRNVDLRSQRSDRKFRLIAVACASRILPLASDADRIRAAKALTLAVRFAEGEIAAVELSNIRQDKMPWTWAEKIALHSCYPDALNAARGVVISAGNFVAHKSRANRSAKRIESQAQSGLIRCVLGNPFRPVSLNSEWLTSDVLALAQGIYDDNAFDRMPILADALQDAGCDNVNVLDHCREEREHVRGCWVIDMLLGKG